VSSHSRFTLLTLAVCSCIGCLIWAPGAASAQTRHHIWFGLGYSNLPSDDLKDETIGVDFSNAANGVLAYRYTLNPQFDITVDSRGTVSTDKVQGVDLTLMGSFFGPGVRWHPGSNLYVQANFFAVSEHVEAEQNGVKISGSDSGTGFGLSGGLDIPMTPLLSLPIELNYNYGKPGDDISGLGGTIGLAFNFGQMK
jgi:hypothetical protein